MVTLKGDEPRSELEESIIFHRMMAVEAVLKSDRKKYSEEVDRLLEAWSLASA